MKNLILFLLCMLGIYSSSCNKEPIIINNFLPINTTYLTNYTHLQQHEEESLWTNYVLVAGTISKTYKLDYRVNEDEIQWVRNHCHNDNSMTILEEYARIYDTKLMCRYEPINHTTEISKITNILREHLNTYGAPFIVEIEQGEQHLIIWDIAWEDEELSSTVYYTDSRLAAKSPSERNIQKASLKTLLNWANNSEYRLFFVLHKV